MNHVSPEEKAGLVNNSPRPWQNFPNLNPEPEIPEPAPEIHKPHIPDRYFEYDIEKPEFSLENSSIYPDTKYFEILDVSKEAQH